MENTTIRACFEGGAPFGAVSKSVVPVLIEPKICAIP